MQRFIVFVTVFLVGIGLAFMVVNRLPEAQTTSGRGPGGRRGGSAAVVAVQVEPLTVGTLTDEGKFVGSIEPTSSFLVAPKLSGRLKKLFVDIGDMVKNGDVIATLDDEELLLNVKQAEADLEIAKANLSESAALLEISKKELARVEKMRQQKVSSDADVEASQATNKTRMGRHQVNRALVSQKESALEAARVRLSYATVDASWTGGANGRFVAERFQNEGSMVSANVPVVSIIDIATVTVVIDVVERDYFKIKPGLWAEIRPAAIEGCVYKARVSRVSPQLDPLSRQARIELELDNVDYELKPGMFINARMIYDTRHSATIAPASALIRRNEKEGLFLVEEASSTARFVAVDIGFRQDEKIEILSPKISGRVVTLGHHLLEDRAAIIISDGKAPATPAEAPEKKGGAGKQQKGGKNR